MKETDPLKISGMVLIDFDKTIEIVNKILRADTPLGEWGACGK